MRYRVAEQGTGRVRHFADRARAVRFAWEQAAAAWSLTAVWSIVDRETDGRIQVNADGVVVEVVPAVAA
jgi:hypothetical protein